ncbi:MAG: SDR family NAD(P)-dependent oxidoreductase [Myxococcales bacterium]|nr:SDR family NAD(P)-dependent oxidoreductase [Myxococcales bacterium]
MIGEIKRETGNEQVEFIALDLSDLASVRACAEALLAKAPKIHGLINNAGVVAKRGSATKDGYEMTFGTNHLGHCLLTRLLTDRLKQTGGARIVNVSSASHYRAKDIDWSAVQKPTKTVVGLKNTSQQARERAVHQGARPPPRGLRRHHLCRSPRCGRDRCLAPVPEPDPLGDQAVRDHPRAGRAIEPRVRDVTRARRTGGRYYTTGGKEKRPGKAADDAELAKTCGPERRGVDGAFPPERTLGDGAPLPRGAVPDALRGRCLRRRW